MGKFFDKVNGMIMDAMKNKEKEKAEVYRALKNEFLKFNTAKNAGELDDSAEVRIINKMVKERTESANVYNSAGRGDLANKENIEADYLQELLPKAATEEEINEAIDSYGEFDKKQMGQVIKFVKSKFDNVDGSVVSKLVMARLS